MYLSFVAMIWTVTSLLVAGVCTICLLQPCWIVHPLTYSSFGLCSYCLNPQTIYSSNGNRFYFNGQSQSSNGLGLRNGLPLSASGLGRNSNGISLNPNGLLNSNLLHQNGYSSSPYMGPHCEFYGHAPSLGGLRLEALPSVAWRAACVLYAGGCGLFCITAIVSVITSCLPDRPYRIRTVRGVAWVQAASVFLMFLSMLIFPASLDTPQARRVCGPNSRPYYADHCQIGWAYMLAVMGTALAFFCPLLARYVDLRVCEPIVDVPRRLSYINKQLVDFV